MGLHVACAHMGLEGSLADGTPAPYPLLQVGHQDHAACGAQHTAGWAGDAVWLAGELRAVSPGAQAHHALLPAVPVVASGGSACITGALALAWEGKWIAPGLPGTAHAARSAVLWGNMPHLPLLAPTPQDSWPKATAIIYVTAAQLLCVVAPVLPLCPARMQPADLHAAPHPSPFAPQGLRA